MVYGAAGGIQQLCELIDKHPEIEGDLIECYSFDLLDVFSGKISARRALLLIDRLAYDVRSHYRSHVLGGMEHHGFDTGNYQLARVIDAIREGTFVAARINGAKRWRSPEPDYRPKLDDSFVKHNDESVLLASTIAELTPAAFQAAFS